MSDKIPPHTYVPVIYQSSPLDLPTPALREDSDAPSYPLGVMLAIQKWHGDLGDIAHDLDCAGRLNDCKDVERVRRHMRETASQIYLASEGETRNALAEVMRRIRR